MGGCRRGLWCLAIAIVVLGATCALRAPAGASTTNAARAAWTSVTAGDHASDTPYPKLDASLNPELQESSTAELQGSARPLVEVHGRDTSKVTALVEANGGVVDKTTDEGVFAEVPSDRLGAVSNGDGVDGVSPPRKLVASSTSEGVDNWNASTRVGATSAAAWQTAGRDGAGETVGVLDIGFAGLAAATASGGPLAGVKITKQNYCGNGTTGFDGSGPAGTDPPTPHGTAGAEVIHQMAPGAALALICIYTDADFAKAAQWASSAGVTVMSDAVGDPIGGRGDGATGSLVHAVTMSTGMVWSVAAGNFGQRHFSAVAKDADNDGAEELFGGAPAPGPDSTETYGFTLDNGATSLIEIRWDLWQYLGTNSSTSWEADICIFQDVVSEGSAVGCWTPNPAPPNGPPINASLFKNTTGASHRYLVALLNNGASFNTNPPPLIDMYFAGQERDLQATTDGSLIEPATSSYALTVAAHCYKTGALEPTSSRGPVAVHYFSGGPPPPLKPDMSAPDGVSNDVYGPSNSSCTGGFVGTSSATAHVAGAAALERPFAVYGPPSDPPPVQTFLRARAVDNGAIGPDYGYGYGMLDMGSLLSMPQHDPTGSLDSVGPSPGGAYLEGWSIDPDVASSNDVVALVDGNVAATQTASQPRADVATAHPDYGADHGFGMSVNASYGSHQFCALAINVSGTRGNFHIIGCKTFNVQGSPIGKLESVIRAPGGVQVNGWTFDPDSTASIKTDVWVDPGTSSARGIEVTAGGSRPDVGGSNPPYGALHGFSALVASGKGLHNVCAYGINAAGPGSNVLLGCKSITISNDPIGAFDSVKRVPGGITVTGWDLDPDTAASINVSIRVDTGTANAKVVAKPASGNRADIAALFPPYGAAHGYSKFIALQGAGEHQVCVVAVNVKTTPGVNQSLGCKTIVLTADPAGTMGAWYQDGEVTNRGWAIDPDTKAAVTVTMWIDKGTAGAQSYTMLADQGFGNLPGPEWKGWGPNHSYNYVIENVTLAPGKHSICTVFTNAPGTAGSNVDVGCFPFTV